MNIVALGDEDTIIGMQLAGIKETKIIENPEQIVSTLRELRQREDVAIILITERLAAKGQEIITQIQQDKTYPIIVEIPDKEGKSEHETGTLKDLVKRAVGVELEL